MLKKKTKKKKLLWKKKGLLGLYTLGDILQGALIAILIAITMYYFSMIRLTSDIVIWIIIACFFGIIIAKIIQDYARFKM